MRSNKQNEILLSDEQANAQCDIKIDKNKSNCSICGQKFRFFKALQKHEARHQGDGGFVCKTCGMHFTSADAREKHRDKEHKILRCKICSIRFDSESEYLHHINSLHDGRDRELSMCSTCGKQFKTKGELKHHVSSKCGTIKKYQCKVCFQTLMTSGSLHNHMLRHTGERSFMCRFCAKTFLTAGQLTVHERIHTQEKAFVCEVCNKGFCHRQSLITHSSIHTGIKPYQCEGCGNSFSCVGNLLKHRKTHAETCGKVPLTTHRVKNPITKYKVQANTPPTIKLKTLEKRKKFQLATIEQNIKSSSSSSSSSSSWHESNINSFEQNLNNNDVAEETKNDFHLQNYFVPDVSLEEEKPDTKIILNDKSFFNLLNNENEDTINDAKDSKLFEKSEHLQASDHEWANNQTNSHRDSDSEMSEDSTDLITRKMKLDQSKRTEKKKRYRKTSSVDRAKLDAFIKERGFDEKIGLNCKYCGNHYIVPLCLMKHELKHEQKAMKDSQKKIFKCSCCNATFETKQECVAHQQTQHSTELTCRDCDKLFANPDSLKVHINVYHKGMPRKSYAYICDKCGKVFKQKALLVTHEENNCADESIYQCNACSKSFTSKHVLKSHMRIHLPEKSLLCKFCGKSFHWKGQLKIHERSHTGEKPFKCEYCSKAFAYRESLITHTTLHTGIKPHLCENCGSRFSCIGNLLKHRRTHSTTCGIVTQVKTEEILSM